MILKVKVNKQQSIVVTPNSGLEYIAGQVLPLTTLLSTSTAIASLVTGPVFSFDLIPPPTLPGSNLVITSKRINLLSSAPPAQRSALPVSPSTVKIDRFTDGLVAYIRTDTTFYIYKNALPLGKCSISVANADIFSFRIAVVNRTTLQRIYIVFENSNNILLLTFYDLLTNTCSPIDVQLQYKVLGTGSDTDVSVSDGSLFLVSPLGTGTASTNDFVLTQFRPGGKN